MAIWTLGGPCWLSQPTLRLAGLWQQFQQVKLSVQRIGDIMNAPAEQLPSHRYRTLSGWQDFRALGHEPSGI